MRIIVEFSLFPAKCSPSNVDCVFARPLKPRRTAEWQTNNSVRDAGPQRVNATASTFVLRLGEHKGRIHFDIRLTAKEEPIVEASSQAPFQCHK
jgi:hypothetical protein